MSDSDEEILAFKTKYDMEVYVDLMKHSSKEIYYGKRVFDPKKNKYIYHPDYATLLIVNRDGTCNIKTTDNKIIKLKSKYIEHIPSDIYSTSKDPKVYEKESYDNLDNFIKQLKVKWNGKTDDLSNKRSTRKRKKPDRTNIKDVKSKTYRSSVKKQCVKKPRFRPTLTKSQAKSDINKIKKDVDSNNVGYKRSWNKKEKELFEEGFHRYGIGKWVNISMLIKSKTPKQVNNYFHNTFKHSPKFKYLNKINNRRKAVEKIKRKIIEEREKESQKYYEALSGAAKISNETHKKLEKANEKIANLEEENKKLEEQLKQMMVKYDTQQRNFRHFMLTISPPNPMFYQPNPIFYQSNPMLYQQHSHQIHQMLTEERE